MNAKLQASKQTFDLARATAAVTADLESKRSVGSGHELTRKFQINFRMYHKSFGAKKNHASPSTIYLFLSFANDFFALISCCDHFALRFLSTHEKRTKYISVITNYNTLK